MKILHITASLRDADFIEHELAAIAPDFRVAVSPTVQDAAARLEPPGAFDAILLDMQLPDGDPTGIITHVRQKGFPLAVVVMLGSGIKEPPMEALKAGANDYIVKRPGFVGQLPGILRRSVERYRAQRPLLRVLYAGEIEQARRELSFEKSLQLEPAVVAQDGSCRGVNDPSSDPSSYDAVVLEEGFLGVHILVVLREILARGREIPVLMLIEPGREEIGVQGLAFGASGYSIKTGNYLFSLPALIREAIARRELAVQRNVLACAEARLRMLMEKVPACIVMLTCEGNILAINWAGLSLVGSRRPEELVGRNFPGMLPEKHRLSLKAFIEGVCRGEPDSIEFEWGGLDGKPRHLELRGVPVRRDSDSTINVLGVMNDLTHVTNMQEALTESKAQLENLQQTLQTATTAKDLERQLQMEQGEWAIVRQEFEQREKAAEEERVQLQERLQSSESRQQELAGMIESQKAQFETDRDQFEQREKAAEEERVQLKERLQSSGSRQQELAGMIESQKAQFEADREQFEQREKAAEEEHVQLQEKLQSSEFRQLELAGMIESQKARFEAEREQFEQREKAAEEERVQLHERLQSSEFRQLELVEMIESQKARFEADREQFEQRVKTAEEERVRLQERLRSSESHQSELVEALACEQAEWEVTRLELGRRIKALEEERVQFEEKLQAAESLRSELNETLAVKLSEWEATSKGFEQRAVRAEEQVIQFQEKLKKAESRLSELNQTFIRGQARWEIARARLEQRIKAAEAERAQLQERFQASELRLAESVEMRARERGDWDLARQELERQARAAEEQLSLLRERFDASGMEKLQEAVRKLDDQAKKTCMLETLLADLRREYEEQRSRWSVMNRELQQKCRDAEMHLSEAAAQAFQNLRTTLKQYDNPATPDPDEYSP